MEHLFNQIKQAVETNKFFKETAILSVYITNLDEYVKGNLMGEWVSLPIEESDFKDFLKTIGNPEEYAIHDYENNLGLDGLKIGEYMSIKKLNELGERIENIKNRDVDALNALYEAIGDFEESLECYESEDYTFYENMTMEEVAQEYIEECYNIPEGLENYIDYKAFARDMSYDNYYETDYGVIAIF